MSASESSHSFTLSAQDRTPLPRHREPELPPEIPDYQLLRLIGQGSYGQVWLARSVTGALRAIKIVYRASFDHDRPYEREFEGIKKFEPISQARESQVAIFHVGRNAAAGFFFYVMELADDAGVDRLSPPSAEGHDEGSSPSMPNEKCSMLNAQWNLETYIPRTLKHDLKTKGALPISDCLQLAQSLATALDHLHSHNLVHRDIKPSNIIFVNGRPKLADIGLVTSTDATRSFVGTDGYIPPEGPGTPQADLYSLGKVLYECVTGKDRLDFPELPNDWKTSRDFDQLLELNEIITTACDSEPRNRYPSADAVLSDLLLLQEGRSVKATRLRNRTRRNTRRFVGFALASAAALLAALLVRQPPKPIGPSAPVSPPLSKVPEAEALYKKAIHIMASATPERRLQAYTNLLEAVTLDSTFAAAYFAMFEVYYDSYVGGKLPPHYNQEKNFRAVQNKLREIAPDSAYYHAASSTLAFGDWRFRDALREAALAVQTDQSFAPAHSIFAYCTLFIMADARAAHTHFGIAGRLNPTDVTTELLKAGPFLMERKPGEAVKQYLKALHLEPRTTQLHLNLGKAYEANRQYVEALDCYERFDIANGRDTVAAKAWYDHLRKELSEKGPQAMWEAELKDATGNPWSFPFRKAELNARLRNTGEVFRLLKRAFDERDGFLPFLLTENAFDYLHEDPRFKEVVDRLEFSMDKLKTYRSARRDL